MARPIWNGSLSFGLINIPIKLYSAIQEKRVSFHLLSADGTCRLREKLFCPETGKEFRYEDTVNGYEIEPDRYVIVSKEELELLGPTRKRSFDIVQFVDLAEIDPVYFARTYYVAPDERGEKPYRLLLEVMQATKKVALGKFVMRQKEYLAALRGGRDLLMLETMYFEEEIRRPEEVGVPRTTEKVTQKELDLAVQVVASLTEPWNAERFHDEYQQRVVEFVNERASGKGGIREISESAAEPTKVIDLMERLKASLRKSTKRSGPQEVRKGGPLRRKGKRRGPKRPPAANE